MPTSCPSTPTVWATAHTQSRPGVLTSSAPSLSSATSPIPSPSVSIGPLSSTTNSSSQRRQAAMPPKSGSSRLCSQASIRLSSRISSIAGGRVGIAPEWARLPSHYLCRLRLLFGRPLLGGSCRPALLCGDLLRLARLLQRLSLVGARLPHVHRLAHHQGADGIGPCRSSGITRTPARSPPR